MCCLGNFDDKFIRAKVMELKKFSESEEILDFSESARSYVDNVYDKLMDLQKPNSLEENALDWKQVETKMLKSIVAGIAYKTLENNGQRKIGSFCPMDTEEVKKIYYLANIV